MKTMKMFIKILCTGIACVVGLSAVQGQEVLITGTEFEVPGKETEAYASLDEIAFIGLLRPTLTHSMTLTPDSDAGTFKGGKYYAVTNNPSKLAPIPGPGSPDEYYYDNNDAYWGLMLSKQTADYMLTLSVSGIKKDAPARVEIEYCIPMRTQKDISGGANGTANFKVAVSGKHDSYNIMNGEDCQLDYNNNNGGFCKTLISNLSTAQVTASGGTLTVYINAKQMGSNPVLIKSIKVYGEILPKIVGPEEVCAGGENAILSVANSYDNATYQWFHNNKKITGATGKNYVHPSDLDGEKTHTYHYTVTVPNGSGGTATVKSEDFIIKDILCCTDANNKPAPRKLIWQDDFGTFTNANSYWVWDYSDIKNPTKKTNPLSAAKWKTCVSYTIPGASCSSGLPGDGQYLVVANITDQGGADIGWASMTGDGKYPREKGLPFYPDNTYPDGNEYGACLMLNCGNEPGDPIYSKTIDGLCDKRLTVKCFINTFSNSANDVEIMVRVTDTKTGNIEESVPIRKSSSGPDAWIPVSVDIILPSGSTEIKFEIISSVGGAGYNNLGNDLLLDDIQVYACSSPSVNAYFNLTDYDTKTISCGGDNVTLYADVTPMLKNFYGTDLAYIFQYTTEDPSSSTFKKTSWKNITSTPIVASEQSDLETIFEDFKTQFTDPNGEKLYFRVVAAEMDRLTTLLATPGFFFNEDDPCSSYSVSKPIEAEIDCPQCTESEKIEIKSSKASTTESGVKTVYLCSGEKTTLTTNDITPTPAYTDYTITWYKGNKTTKVGTSTTGVTASSLEVNYSDVTAAGVTYYVQVIDEAFPLATTCHKWDEIKIIARPIPTVDAITAKTYCAGNESDKIEFTSTPALTGTTYEWTNTNSAIGLAATGSGDIAAFTTTNATNSAISGTIEVTPKANGCTGSSESFTITVNPEAEITLSSAAETAEQTVCLTNAITNITYSLSGGATNATVAGLPAGVTGSFASGVFTISGTPTASGTFDYTVTTSGHTAPCAASTATGKITVNKNPEYTISGAGSYCPESTSKDPVVVRFTEGEGLFNFTINGNTVTDAASPYSISNPTAGSYALTNVTDANGCKFVGTAPAAVVVTDLATPTLNIAAIPGFCKGSKTSVDISEYVTAEADATVSYAINNTSVEGGSISSSGELTVGSETGIYVIDVTVTGSTTPACSQTMQASVEVWENPEVTFGTNPTELCLNESDITLAVSPSPTTGGTGTFTGASTSSTFSPTTVGEKDITYTFVDANGCKNSATHTIKVIKVDAPTVASNNNPKVLIRNSSGNLNGTTELTCTKNAAGDNVLWFDNEATPNQKAKDTYEFQTGLTKTSPEGTYRYQVQSYREIAGGRTCYSEMIPASISISDCPAEAVSAKNQFICFDEDGNAASVTATEPTIPPTTYNKVAWFDADPIGKTGENPTGINQLGTGTTYTSATLKSNASSLPASETVYVATYNQTNDCWSAGTAVTLTVVENPTAKIEVSDADFCADSEVVTFTLTPATAPTNGTASFVETTSFGGLNTTNNTWDAKSSVDASTPLATIEVEYTVTETHGNIATDDQATCSTTVAEEATAHFMAPPIPEHKTWLIGDIANIPDDFKTAQTSGIGEEIHWYEDNAKANKITTGVGAKGLTFTPDKAALASKAEIIAAIAAEKDYTHTYWITQTNEHGCESEPVEANLLLVACPWKAPEVVGNNECKKELPATGMELKASKPVTTTETPSAWHWYTSETGATLQTGAPTALGDNSSYSSTATSTTTYWVSYSAEEPISKKTCESPRTAVTLTVHADPVITSLKQSKLTTLCNTDTEDQINASVTWNDEGDNNERSETWSIKGQTAGIDSNGNFNPKTWGETTADYTVVYEVTNDKGCKDSDELPVPVQFAPAPTIKLDPNGNAGYFAAPTNGVTVTVEAEGLGDDTNSADKVTWYADQTISTMLTNGNQNPFPTGDDSDERIAYPGKNYWVSQTIRGCESERTAATVVIDCPVPAPQTTDVIICNYFDYPELSVTPGVWAARPTNAPEYRFYTSLTDATPVETNSTGKWKPTSYNKDSETDITYYVSEFNAGASPIACESSRTPIKIEVKKAPDNISIPAQNSICEYENNPTFTIANNVMGAKIEWYVNEPVQSETPGATVEATGSSYSPLKTSINTVGKHSVWATQRITYSSGGATITCMSNPAETTLIINEKPAQPTPTAAESCFGEAFTSLSVTGKTGATLRWYNSNSATATAIASGARFTPTSAMIPSAKAETFYVTQIVKGCESEKTAVVYTLKPKPTAPTLSPNAASVCDYDSDPIFTATTSNASAVVKWYAPLSNNYLSGKDGVTLQADRAISTSYYATQTIDGCESDVRKVDFTVKPVVAAPVTYSATMCQNDEQIPSLRSNGTSLTDTWYYDAALTSPITPNPGNMYIIPESERPTSDVTFYVQRQKEGCLSTPSSVTMTVVEIPDFEISSDQKFCVYEEATVSAFNFSPAMNAQSKVEWQLTQLGDSHSKTIADNAAHELIFNNNTLPAAGEYQLTATYRYITPTSNCASSPQVVAIIMNDRPNPPVVASRIVCQGTTLEALNAFGSPNINWTFIDGPMPLTDWVGDTYDFNRIGYNEIAVGKYSFELFDVDPEGCKSSITSLKFEVAPQAETKIVGNNELCASTALEEPYTVEKLPEIESKYYWKTSGDVYNYSKDGNIYSPSKYIDWHKQGIDTIYVKEVTWAGCEGFDTLVVNIAPYPVAHYTWSLPGAETTVEFLDSSFQAPITSRYDESIEPIQLEYSMSWSFDRVPSLNPNQVDLEVPYAERNIPITVEEYTYGYKYPVLTVTNQYGCSAEYKTEVFVDVRSGVYIPNAFSPLNAAASVRTFKPIAFNLESGKFWVYDSWGNLLYYSDEVKDGMFVGEWNGTYGGELMLNGVYMWKMEAKFIDGTTWPGQKKRLGGYSKFGNVTLIR